MVAAVVLAQWHTNEAVWRKAEPRECNIVISDTEPESLLQYNVNGMRRHRSQPFMGFLNRPHICNFISTNVFSAQIFLHIDLEQKRDKL